MNFSWKKSSVLTPKQTIAITEAQVSSTLTEEQVMAINQALVTAQAIQPWRDRHPVNLRFTIPISVKRYT